jgi:hypothetical protein
LGFRFPRYETGLGTGINFKAVRLIIRAERMKTHIQGSPSTVRHTPVRSDGSGSQSARARPRAQDHLDAVTTHQILLEDGRRPTPQQSASAPGGGVGWGRPRPSPLLPAPSPPAPSPLPPPARDSTRASCTRAPSKQKQRRTARRAAPGTRGGGRDRARAPVTMFPAPRPRLRLPGRHRTRAPAGRGAGGQRAPPCLPPGPRPRPRSRPGNGLSGAGARVRTHPARPLALRGRRPAPPNPAAPSPPAAACHPRHDSTTHFAPSLQLQRSCRPPHVAASSLTQRSRATRDADPGAQGSRAGPHPASDVTLLGPPNSHLPPRARRGRGRGKGAEMATSCQKPTVFHMTKLSLTPIISTHAAA